MKINKVAVIGAGIMGSGIAQVCAQSGFIVRLFDSNKVALSKAVEGIEKNLNLLVSKGKINPTDVGQILKKIDAGTNLKDAANNADIVIEAIPEQIELKKKTVLRIRKHLPSTHYFCQQHLIAQHY